MKGSTIVHGRKSACGIAVLRAAYAAGSPRGLLLLQGKAPPCHITGLSPGLARNKVLRMEISFGKLQNLA